MIGMFDRDRTGTINFQEFGALWKYVNDWQTTFRSYDKDNSGSIDRGELKTGIGLLFRLSHSLPFPCPHTLFLSSPSQQWLVLATDCLIDSTTPSSGNLIDLVTELWLSMTSSSAVSSFR